MGTRLEERGIETSFLIPTGSDEFDDAATEAGFRTHRLSVPRIRPPKRVVENLKFLVTFFQVVKKITGVIESESIDLVHANMSLNFQTALAAAETDTPLAWHFHDTLVPTPARQIASVLGRR